MRKLMVLLLLLCALLCLSGCTQTQSAALPDLHLLEPIPYTAQKADESAIQPVQEAMQLDLWLDASQVMGGINQNDQSMYPRSNQKYREGGFHYRYKDEAGQYEALLRCMLASAGNARVRVLRVGTERVTDEFLTAQRLVRDGNAETLRSLRRDMLTYAVDPLPTLFSEFSGERMTDSFYSLGSPLLNQLKNVPANQLENPALSGEMSDALDELIDALPRDEWMAQNQDDDWPLLYALDNIDLSRLSVIVFDPAGMRRLSTVETDGTPVELVAQLLEERGVFDRGLTAGLYAFTLDYMGQISSFGTADFAEPLLWGKLKYNGYREVIEGVLPMPRTLLALTVGPEAQVETYRRALERQTASSEVLNELRGPMKGELTYASGGETITQQPFAFSCNVLSITRPALTLRTQQAADVTVASSEIKNGLPIVNASPDAPFEALVTLPLDSPGVASDLSVIKQTAVSVEDTLILTAVVPSTDPISASEDAQVLALRDKRYVFDHQTLEENPFRVEASAKDGMLSLHITADEGLIPGYYRLSVSADYASGSAEWQTPAWVEERNAAFTSEDVGAWEAFTQQMARYERKREYISRPFQHAWGPATENTYHGLHYPDFPPVWNAPGLSELVRQLQSAANVLSAPCLRYTFDVFVKP